MRLRFVLSIISAITAILRRISQAVSVGDAVALSRSGLTPNLIINQIRTNGVQQKIGVQEIIMLHDNGVPEIVIQEMQKARIAGTPTVHVARAPVVITPRPTVIVERRPQVIIDHHPVHRGYHHGYHHDYHHYTPPARHGSFHFDYHR